MVLTNPTPSEYQILLIKYRLYRPNNIPVKYRELFKNSAEDISYDIAKEIFYAQNYQDPSMRGRQSANPLNKLGFCIARNSLGPVRITKLGNLFLNSNADIGYIFFKSMLKLQYPNPLSKDFSVKKGFNVNPFLSTLRLMKLSDGLTQKEFCLFTTTLINYEDIKRYFRYIEKRRAFKKKKAIDAFDIKFLKNFYGVKKLSRKQMDNPFEYGDNLMRYFRLTKYFQIIKNPLGGWKINLAPLRMKEINQLLKLYDGSAIDFESLDDYIEYLANIEKPELPWELDANKTSDIVKSLLEVIRKDFSELQPEQKGEVEAQYLNLSQINLRSLDPKELENVIANLREFRLKMIQLKQDSALKHNITRLKQIISILEDKKQLRSLDPVDFEFLISESFKIIDDEIIIKPNCILDDNGKPVGFAPGNKADIEGYYDKFNTIFEATLDTSRHQVYRESIPVMRHLKNFAVKNPDKPAYCIFIAPRVHDDTINYFWYAVKFGFEGEKQKIIALELPHLLEIFKFFVFIIENNKSFYHHNLELLLETIVKEVEQLKTSTDWLRITPEKIKKWQTYF